MKKVRTSAKGRVCRYRSCRNILSIYNHEEYCHAHQLLALSGNINKAPSPKKEKTRKQKK